MEVKQVIVHRFSIPDAEDPEIYAAEPIWNWQQTDAGKWIMERAVEQPMWHRNFEAATYYTNYYISAKLTAKDYTFWTLKWGSNLK